MITKSFLFLNNIGKVKEQDLWSQGINHWNDFLKSTDIKGISRSMKERHDVRIEQAKRALYNSNAAYFTRLLPQSENWRLYDFFKDEAVFLDIETTGCSYYDDITVIGLFDGINTKSMIKGVNLDYEVLKEELSHYKLILTFNGGSFDLPFIAKRFPGVLPRIPHIDLRTVTGRLGYSGGLKNVEKDFGVERRDLVEGIDGGDAITLWRMYRATGDDHYLKLLVEYNEEDVINLKKIADRCCKRLEQETVTESLQ